MSTIYLLITSPRLPVGLLTAQAWDLLKTHAVYTQESSELTELLEQTGVKVSFEPMAALAEHASEEGLVFLAGDDQAAARSFAINAVRQEKAPTIEVVYGSWDPPGAKLLDVVSIMDRLRSPGGCPWDAEQTTESLMPYLLEEAYEAYDALKTGDRAHIREELGDLLLQVAFHSRLAEELPDEERWSIDDVSAGLVEKLVSRHPHIFGDVEVADAAEVKDNWEEIKRKEKKRTSALDGVARSAPALSLVAKYLDKAENFKLSVATPELPAGLQVTDDAEQLGDLLFAVVAAARASGVDSEAALRDAADRFAGRVRAAETRTEL